MKKEKRTGILVDNAGLSNEELYIEPLKVYDDEFYDNYIKNFKQRKKINWFYRFLKRSFDFFAALIGIIILSPILLIIAIAIKIDSKGPVIFKQKRVGKNSKEFMCYKFRTMKTTAPKDCPTAELKNPEQWYTGVGRFLRLLSLDEFAQFFNVLKGDMSFIGPRPVPPNHELLINTRKALGADMVRPGISGYAQVHGRDDVYDANKAIMDAYYVKKASLWFDIKMIFKTIWCVIKRDGNDAKKGSDKKDGK